MTCYRVWSIPLGKRFFLFSWFRFGSSVPGRAWSWLCFIKFCFDVTLLILTAPQSHSLRCGEWHDMRFVCLIVWKSGCVGAARVPPLQLFWGATTCPHSAGNRMSLRYPVKKMQVRTSDFFKNSQSNDFQWKKFFFSSPNIQNLSPFPFTNRETFLSFPLLGWYRRKVTDLSHHQPSAWLTNQICPSLTVLCLITPNNLPVTSNQKLQ